MYTLQTYFFFVQSILFDVIIPKQIKFDLLFISNRLNKINYIFNENVAYILSVFEFLLTLNKNEPNDSFRRE